LLEVWLWVACAVSRLYFCFLLSAFCFCLALPPAYGLGDGAKPPENRQNRQNLPVDALGPAWQDEAATNESEKQFSFTRAASSTSGGAKSKFLSVQK
jgi:hypothetical protein